MDIVKEAVYDPRIVQETPTKYAVCKGAVSTTQTQFKAIASTPSQSSFSVQVPSLSTIIDRYFELQSSILVSFTATVSPAPAIGEAVVVFGRDIAFCSMPHMSLVSTLTAQINDTATTINLNDVLREICRFTDDGKNNLLRAYPYMLDKYANYNDGAGAINSILSSYYEAQYEEVPNGAFGDVVFTDPTGATAIAPPVGDGATTTFTIYARITTSEPLLLSPFIFAEQYANKEVGLSSVNNIQVILNYGGSNQISRLIRNQTLNGRIISNVQLNGANPFPGASLNVIFRTPSLDLPLMAFNQVSYLEYPRFISTYQGTSIPPNTTVPLTSQTITLPVVPDLLVIYAKPSAYTQIQGDFYLPITGVSITFDNFSGILSSFTKTSLFRTAVQNNLRMDYNTWNGRVYTTNPTAGYTTPASGQTQSVGGFLVLKPGIDFQLASGSAPGVVGQYVLSVQANVFNPDQVNPVANPLLYIMTINSGVFTTQSGSSRIVRGLLSESDVVSAPMSPLVSSAHMERYIGSGFFDKLGSALSKAGDFAMSQLKSPAVRGMVKDLASRSGVPALKKAGEVAGMFGFGSPVSGGVVSGGVVSGGRRRNPRMTALM
jgi:hypothetical protein